VVKSGKRENSMFRGINAINLDDKGRMALPKRYREALEKDAKGQVVVTIDTEEHCLLLYPLPVWEEIELKVEALPSFNKLTRRIQRLLIGHATELVLDGNGRVLLPPLLREYAHLGKSVVLLGQGKKFEIWDEKSWKKGREVWLKDELLTTALPEELRSISL
jgi:MraZ protein